MTILRKCTTLAVIMIAFLSSCEINEIHEEYMNSYSQDFTVHQRDWKLGQDDDSGNYFYYEFKEPNLTQYVYDKGIMQAFLVMNGGNLTPLPFNDYWYEGDYNNYHWTEQVTCEFRPGYVTFILKYSDHATGTDPYYDYNFRTRFMW